MPGATLSRWTMSYFAAALLFLVGGETLMVLGFGYPSAAIEAPETFLVVHLIAVGWLGLLMSGALLQFVPVLVAQPLRCPWLAVPALLSLVAGLSCLSAGFLGLAGSSVLPGHALPAGGFLITLGFVLVVVMIGSTLGSASPLPLPARFVVVGLFSLCGTMMLGLIFALVLSGETQNGPAADLLLHAVPLHASLGLGGWMSFTAMGVSYRLLAMFLLAPERTRTTSKIVCWTGAAALALVAGCAPLVLSIPAALGGLLPVAGLLALLAIALYAGDILRIYRDRKRRVVELNSRASLGAFAALVLSAMLFAIAAATGNLATAAGPATYLFAFGWLTGLGLAQLYKITPFLTWLECYGPVLGRVPTPRVQDLVKESRAVVWFRLYYGAVSAATIALFASEVDLFRIAALIQIMTTLGLIAEFIRTRRLAEVAVLQRFPTGVVRPNLFLPIFSSRRS